MKIYKIKKENHQIKKSKVNAQINNSQKTNNYSYKFFTLFLFTIMSIIMTTTFAQAGVVLDGITFDPAIIAAGDEVDVVIQYHVESNTDSENRIGNTDYKFKAKIIADDTLSEKYVTVVDEFGDDVQGHLFSGDYFNRKFRVKVSNSAPAGNYEFKLEGKWYLNDRPTDGSQYIKFKMPVKKEGIILGITNINTVPSEIRPGDNYVKLVTQVENVGQKDSKSVEVTLNLPDGIDSSYSNNNRLWIGRVNAGESKEAIFYIDIDEDTMPGVKDLEYSFTYSDLDDNKNSETTLIPLLVKSRPQIEVVDVVGTGVAGKTTEMKVYLKNTGTESAEAVDVRIIKQNAQPFVIDVRSDYIGELEPNETGVAIFSIKTNSNAEFKEHDFKLLIRSKGDSDEGDDNIYTYNRRAKFDVNKKSNDLYFIVGVIGIIALIIILIIKNKNKRR